MALAAVYIAFFCSKIIFFPSLKLIIYVILENKDQEKQDKGKESKLQKIKVLTDLFKNFHTRECSTI